MPRGMHIDGIFPDGVGIPELPNTETEWLKIRKFTKKDFDAVEAKMKVESTKKEARDMFYSAVMGIPYEPWWETEGGYLPNGEPVLFVRYEDGGIIVKTARGERWVKKLYRTQEETPMACPPPTDSPHDYAPLRTHFPPG